MSSSNIDIGSDIQPIPLTPLPKHPLVSVLIPNYNYGHLIEEAVASVLNQTYQNFEIIICDDGSTDNSQSVIERLALQDSRICAIYKSNGGVSSALNVAFSASRGNLIALLDADDLWFPKRLEEVVQTFRFSPLNPGMIVHPLQVTELESGKVIKDQVPRHPDRGWLAPRLLRGEHCIFPPASGLIIRKEIALKVFPLPEEFRVIADGILRERAALLAPVEIINAVLGLYRQHMVNVTGFYGKVEKSIASTKVLLIARASFIRELYGIDINPEKWMQQGGGWIGEMILAEMVLQGKNFPLKEVISRTRGKRRIIWIILSILPHHWRCKLLRWWWEDTGILKKVMSILFPLSY